MGLTLNQWLKSLHLDSLVNAGIYVLSPAVIELVRSERYLDMPDLN